VGWLKIGNVAGMKKILVVDDEAFFLHGLGNALRTATTEVTVVETGKEALREIAATPYNLCFLDICLPDIDGVAVLKQIKEISPRTKVIMMTAGVVNTVNQTTIEKDAYMFLTKPFDLFQVRMLAKSVLEEERETAA
jgi:DNA-binding NtrC family response regulator